MKGFIFLVCSLLVLMPSASAEETRNIIAGSNHIAAITDGEASFFHRDRLGSIRFATDFSGQVIDEHKALPFGEEVKKGNLRYTFTGKEKDPSGLFHMGARYYQPDLGRFVSADPAGVGYVYTENNPLKFVDPTGEYLETPVDIASLAFSIHEYRNDPGILTGTGVALDAMAVITPVIPGGAGLLIKSIRARVLSKAFREIPGLVQNRRDIKIVTGRASRLLGFGDAQRKHLRRLVEQHDYTKPLSDEFIQLDREARRLDEAGESAAHLSQEFRRVHSIGEAHHISVSPIIDDLISQGAPKEVIENIVLENMADFISASVRRSPIAGGNPGSIPLDRAIDIYKGFPDFSKAVDVLGRERAEQFLDAARAGFEEMLERGL